jgi:hypothetical protein
MRTRSTLILAAVVAALGTWIYIVESEGPTTGELEERKSNVFASFDRDKVESLELTHDGATVKLEKKAGKWRVVRPVETGADEGAVDAILSAVEFLSKTRTIDAADARKKRADFGLDHPRVRGTVRIRGKAHSFSVGGADSTGEGVYLAVRGDDHVYVVPKDFHDSVAKGLGELRDKRIVEVRVSKAKAVVIRGGAAEARLKKSEGSWHLEAPVRGRASKAKVEEIVRGMESLRAERFVADGAQDLARYGLSPPWRSVKVEVEGGSPVTLLVGAVCDAEAEGESEDAGRRHVLREGTRTVACARSDLWRTLEADPRTLRDRRLLTTRDEDVTKIELAQKGRKVRIERDGDDFRIVEPGKAPADRDAVVRLLSELRSLEATELVAAEGLGDKGLEPPAVTVTIEREGGREVLHVGARDGDSAWVRRGDEPEVLRAPGRVVELAVVDGLRFRPRRLVNDDALDAVSLKIQGGSTTQELGKTEGAWRVTSPVALRADSLAARDVVRRLAELTVERWVAERAEPAHGLGAPRLRLTVKFERQGEGGDEHGDDGDADADAGSGPARPRERVREYTLVVGAQTDGGYFARLQGPGGGDAVFVVSTALVDDALSPLIDRNLFQIDEASLASVIIEHGATRVELVHEGEGWKKGGAEVPRDRVSPLLDKLASVRALRAVGFGPATATAGLASPVLRVTLVRRAPEEGEPDRVEMVFGAASGEGADAGHFARRGDVDATLLVPKEFVDTFTGASF